MVGGDGSAPGRCASRSRRPVTEADGNDGLDRLPAATEYTVTGPAGTESVNGAELVDEVSFSFTTPR